MIKQILRYWRASVADGDRNEPQCDIEAGDKAGAFRVPREQVLAGSVTEEVANLLFTYYITQEKTRGEPVPADMPTIPVLLCPVVGLVRVQSAKKKGPLTKPVIPVCMEVMLNRAGELTPSPGKSPWIPRRLLDPTEAAPFTLGLAIDLDEFMTHNPVDEVETWAELMDYWQRMLKEVTGTDGTNFLPVEAVESPDAVIVVEKLVQGSTLHLKKLYDHLLSESDHQLRDHRLLAHFATIEESKPQPLLDEVAQLSTATLHTGQMNGQFSLSPSQRRTLHHFLSTGDGEVFAVNGPPGTGKTTLLQSVVASMWVSAALNEQEAPIVVATSTNNQAVRNVIVSFGKGKEDADSPLGGRWLPGVNSFGLYCVSDQKFTQATKDFQCVTPKNDGFLGKTTDAQYLEQAKAYFLERCGNYFGRSYADLPRARNALHEALAQTLTAMADGLKRYATWQEQEAYILKKFGSLAALDSKIAAWARAHQERGQDHAERIRLRQQWLLHANAQWLWELLSFLIPFRRLLARRHELALSQLGIVIAAGDFADTDSISARIRDWVDEAEALTHEALTFLEEYRTAKAKWEGARAAFNHWREKHGVDVAPSKLLDWLDRNWRYKAFQVATHYWEARWLEMALRTVDLPTPKRVARVQEQRWRHAAMLTPCLVATTYMVPAFFIGEADEKYLLDRIDLLIVDEAGQVSPEIGGAVFALARRALIVGDTWQIEPVWNVPVGVDHANLATYGLGHLEDPDARKTAGIAASSGSVMRVAQRASRYWEYQAKHLDRGMYLIEHGRCYQEIIGFCNDLVYQGVLVPVREAREANAARATGEPQPSPRTSLPLMGFIDAPGTSERRNGSRLNYKEAEAIGSWLRDNRDML